MAKTIPEKLPRKLKVSKRRVGKLKPQIKALRTKVRSAPRIFAAAWRHIFSNKRLYAKITSVYIVLTVVLVKGFGSGANLPEIKSVLQELFTGSGGELTTNLTLFGVLLNSVGSATTDVAALYQSVLLIIISLALIWAIRQRHADVQVGGKDAFYKSMYPLVQFILVLVVIGLQMLPIVIAGAINSIVFGGGLAVGLVENLFWVVVIFGLVLLSLYWLTASVFALYIVTLPGSTPLEALRSARHLVRLRRWMVMRKLIFLPIAVLVIGAVIMLPILFYATGIAEWAFFILSMFGLLFFHTYIYTLYRDLL